MPESAAVFDAKTTDQVRKHQGDVVTSQSTPLTIQICKDEASANASATESADAKSLLPPDNLSSDLSVHEYDHLLKQHSTKEDDLSVLIEDLEECSFDPDTKSEQNSSQGTKNDTHSPHSEINMDDLKELNELSHGLSDDMEYVEESVKSLLDDPNTEGNEGSTRKEHTMHSLSLQVEQLSIQMYDMRRMMQQILQHAELEAECKTLSSKRFV